MEKWWKEFRDSMCKVAGMGTIKLTIACFAALELVPHYIIDLIRSHTGG